MFKLLPIVLSTNDEYVKIIVFFLAKKRPGGFAYVLNSSTSDENLIIPYARNFITPILNVIKYKS